MSENPNLPPHLSLIIPCYNEADVLPLLRARLEEVLDKMGLIWEVIFVDDGSVDATPDHLSQLHAQEPRFKVISFSRNFGHQAAISAGLSFASGDLVGIMDADLQDPPELFPDCLERLREGYDVVYAVRRRRKETFFLRMGYALFYRLMRLLAKPDIPLDAGDFCLMRRPVVDVLKQLPERSLYLRGLRAWTGFRQVGLEYDRHPRAAGRTKYRLVKLVGLATDGLFSFSTLPLRLAVYLGFVTTMFAGAWGLLHVAWRICGFRLMGHTASELPGWTTLACGMFFFGGVQLLILGCIGEYIGRIYTEVKQRPRWIIRALMGFASQEQAIPPCAPEVLCNGIGRQ